MSIRTSKPRCGHCLAKVSRGADFCTTCGAPLGAVTKALGSAFYDEADPTVREQLWKAAQSGLTKDGA